MRTFTDVAQPLRRVVRLERGKPNPTQSHYLAFGVLECGHRIVLSNFDTKNLGRLKERGKFCCYCEPQNKGGN